MRGSTRNQVALLGDYLPNLTEPLAQRRLELIPGDPAALTTGIAPIRVVLVGFNPSLREQLVKLFLPVLDSGAALWVVLNDPGHKEEHLAQATTVISTIKRQSGALPIRVLYGWEPHLVAEECAEYSAGPPPNRDLLIETPEAVPPSLDTLLRRAFADFATIRIEPLKPGSSASAVLRVEAFARDGKSCEPFVVKVGRRDRISSEISRVKDFVLRYVPFQNHPPIVPERCAVGAVDALCVSMFVDRALRLDAYLVRGAPRLVIASLFEGPLRRWRENQVVSSLELGKEYLKYGVFRDQRRLIAAYEKATASGRNVRPAEDLIALLANEPAIDVRLAQAHGDLHLRNIYVRHNSSDVVLIDFEQTGQQSPLARDPATLDVSIALEPIEGLPQLDEATLRAIYTRPLLPPQGVVPRDNRLEAIRQVRIQAWGDGALERDYELAVACYLLRFSGFDDRGDAGSVAYELADTLLQR